MHDQAVALRHAVAQPGDMMYTAGKTLYRGTGDARRLRVLRIGSGHVDGRGRTYGDEQKQAVREMLLNFSTLLQCAVAACATFDREVSDLYKKHVRLRRILLAWYGVSTSAGPTRVGSLTAVRRAFELCCKAARGRSQSRPRRPPSTRLPTRRPQPWGRHSAGLSLYRPPLAPADCLTQPSLPPRLQLPFSPPISPPCS